MEGCLWPFEILLRIWDLFITLDFALTKSSYNSEKRRDKSFQEYNHNVFIEIHNDNLTLI
ncbi:hypothetical protein BC751_1381 [Cecembia calidifontis]|jgi:hypothetical protein|uniref:Uncharacterized protein n=1 Tax=Cecembia calidifontis TaxID=1187080 RepID=A0A4Q7P6V4_9BACT|nr:hypothetical protein BC751_1381 [Cecembia calidifontis]